MNDVNVYGMRCVIRLPEGQIMSKNNSLRKSKMDYNIIGLPSQSSTAVLTLS
jgi:hypothetical protein